ncbi:hypothetical protein KAU32_04950 [bacterium]|nr:hypothetical protein [bacterium]
MGQIGEKRAELETSKGELANELDKEQYILRTVIRSISDVGIGVAVIDSDHNITYQSKFFQDRYQALLGTKCFRKYLSLENPCDMCPLSHDQSNSSEFIVLDKNDCTYSVSSVLESIKNKRHLICVFHNISAKIKLQEQLLHSQKMDAIGRFVASIVHDFNNLLTPIMTLSELGAMDISNQSKLLEYLKSMKASAVQGKELTGQLLSFSRKQIMNPIPLDLNEIMKSIEKMLRLIVGENIVFKYFPEKQLVPIEIDAEQFKQVLINLTSNAKDAMREGGTLIFETANIEHDEFYSKEHAGIKPGKYVRLSVSDSGVGFKTF